MAYIEGGAFRTSNRCFVCDPAKLSLANKCFGKGLNFPTKNIAK